MLLLFLLFLFFHNIVILFVNLTGSATQGWWTFTAHVCMYLCLFVCMCACLYADNTFLNPFFVFSSHLLTLLISLLLYPCYSFLLHIPQLVGCLPLLLLLVKIGLRSTIFASNVGNVDKLHSEMQKQ